MSDQIPNYEVTSDDKLLVLLAYIFSPLVPIIILLMEEKKNRPFIKAHNAQALVVGLVAWILNVVLSWTCIVPIAILVGVIYLAYQGYQGKLINIPIITDFVKNQGWA